MSYRKFAAKQLFTGHETLGEDAVLVTRENGTIEEIVSRENAGDGVEVLHGILSPGFINCHCHLELSHMKGLIPEQTGMVKFLLTVMSNRNATDDQIREAIISAEAEMTINGIVAVGDICNTAKTIPQKTKRHLHYQNFIETMGFVEHTAAVRFGQAKELYRQFKEIQQPASIVPHAPYSVSSALLAMINAFESGSLLSLHNQESEAENDLFVTGSGDFTGLFEALSVSLDTYRPSGESSMKTTMPLFSKDHSMLLVHNVATSRSDLEWVERNKKILPQIFWCLCPNANLYITGLLPDIHSFPDAGERMVVGTDSLASNHELSILSELKTLQKHFPFLKTEELLRWATWNGAVALRMQEQAGSFEKGKKPGVLLIEGVNEKGSLQEAAVQVLL